jgi:predicted ATPase
MRRDAHTLQVHAAELLQVAEKIPNWFAPGAMNRGTAATMLGQLQEGIAQIRAGMAAQRSQSKRCDVPRALGALASAQAKAGHPEEGLATLAEALSLVEETDERYWEAELCRLRAELLLMVAVPQSARLRTEAEASLHKAIDVARRQKARSWELRATFSLARLWQAQGRIDEARDILAAIYGWFTEGFDTLDLQEAKRLLGELS